MADDHLGWIWFRFSEHGREVRSFDQYLGSRLHRFRLSIGQGISFGRLDRDRDDCMGRVLSARLE
jgi:hypothetical protein